jgi:hypothetical protein
MNMTIYKAKRTTPQNNFNFNQYLPEDTGLGNTNLLQGYVSSRPNQEPVEYKTENISSSPNSYIVKILQAETGSPTGNPTALADIGDGAGLTGGMFQFTEKSGRLGELAKMLGTSTRDPNFRNLLGTPQGIEAQKQLFNRYYVQPAMQLADKYNIKDPTARWFIVDTYLNGGAHDVLKRTGPGASLQALKQARAARYHYLANKNPGRYGKFLKGWMNRINMW